MRKSSIVLGFLIVVTTHSILSAANWETDVGLHGGMFSMSDETMSELYGDFWVAGLDLNLTAFRRARRESEHMYTGSRIRFSVDLSVRNGTGLSFYTDYMGNVFASEADAQLVLAPIDIMYIWQPLEVTEERLGKLYVGFGPTVGYLSEKVGSLKEEYTVFGFVTSIGIESSDRASEGQVFIEAKFRILNLRNGAGLAGEFVKVGGASIIVGVRF